MTATAGVRSVVVVRHARHTEKGMDMSSTGVWCHTDVGVSAGVALDRLPASMTAAGIGVRLCAADARQGTFGRHARLVPARWSTGHRHGGGYLEIAPLASDRAQLLLHLDAPTGRLLDEPARTLLRGLGDRLEGRPPVPTAEAPATVTAGRRRRVAVATATVCVPAAVLGLFLLVASPSPVSVDDRVAQFRAHGADEETTTARSPGSEAGQPAPAAAGDRAADVADDDAGGQASSTPEQPAPATVSHEEAGQAGGGVEGDGDATDRAQPGRRSEPAEGLRPPEPGVYRYATTGGEQLSVRGSARDYPETTTITVRHDQCGFTERWDVFDERWEQRDWCLQDDRRPLVAMTSYREFFGHGQRNELTCHGDAPPMRVVGPGTRWTVVCEDEDTTATSRVEVMGRSSIEVDGEQLDTAHVRMETRIEGETSGRMTGERWIVPATGLLVREQWETEVETSGPVGPVDYTEEYTLRLESTTPAR